MIALKARNDLTTTERPMITASGPRARGSYKCAPNNYQKIKGDQKGDVLLKSAIVFLIHFLLSIRLKWADSKKVKDLMPQTVPSRNDFHWITCDWMNNFKRIGF